MKLLFKNSNGNERVIADVNSFSEANEEIDKFLDEHNFKSYYKRLWEENSRMWVDVGSHTEFFIVEGCTFADVHKDEVKE